MLSEELRRIRIFTWALCEACCVRRVRAFISDVLEDNITEPWHQESVVKSLTVL